MTDKMKIAVIHGGTSTESEFSTENAKAVYASLKRAGHDATMLFYEPRLLEKLQKNRPDLVFLCVQGAGHGDGTLQGILDFMNIPYTGTGMQLAAEINDKVICQALFADEGLPVAKHFSMSLGEYESVEGVNILEQRMQQKGMQYPVVSKAIAQGTCIGIRYIIDKKAYCKIRESFSDDFTDKKQRILIEEYLEGESFTVPLLATADGWEALTFIGGDILQKPDEEGNTIYDHFIHQKPVSFSKEIDEKIKADAVKVADLMGARDYCRVDFIYNEAEKKAYILEINAVPGLRADSYFPIAALASGMSFDTLICRIVESAQKRVGKGRKQTC